MSSNVLRDHPRLVAVVAVVLAAALVWAGAEALAGPSARTSGGSRLSPSTAVPDPVPGSKPSSGPTRIPAQGSLATVPAGEMRTRRPVPWAATAGFGTGVALRVATVEDVRGVARGPGEIEGPAVRLGLVLENHTPRPVSLESVVLSLDYGRARTPAVTLTGPGGRPFGGVLGPSRTTAGRYVFVVPRAARDRVRLTASYTGTAPAVVFQGTLR